MFNKPSSSSPKNTEKQSFKAIKMNIEDEILPGQNHQGPTGPHLILTDAGEGMTMEKQLVLGLLLLLWLCLGSV